MKSSAWTTYRTRFLVTAKQLSSSLSFIDHLGRQHVGRKGDYLVESSDGVISIAPRQIFEDIYVPIGLTDEPTSSPSTESRMQQSERSDTSIERTREPQGNRRRYEPLHIEQVKSYKSSTIGLRVGGPGALRRGDPNGVRRKLPQPFRDRHSPVPRLRLM